MNEIIQNFQIDGNVISIEKFGSGHINKTYKVVTDKNKYVFQCINNNIFKDIPSLMKNIELVCSHIKNKIHGKQQALRIIKTNDNKTFYFDGENYYRLFNFIDNSVSLDKVEDPEEFYQSAIAFGEFANMLSDFDANILSETITNFHNTKERYKQLFDAIKNDPLNRVHDLKKEIDFFIENQELACKMQSMKENGDLPLRVTHNDTKLNNVMLDEKDKSPVCVIDLDCVMPGLAGHDFGDSIRFGANTASEDETNLELVNFDINLFEIYTKGYLEVCKSLTENEIKTLALSAITMTIECGSRFLTDYINGDKYFSISRPNHNLDRCRVQIKLASQMIDNLSEMNKIIEKYKNIQQ